MSCGKMAYTLVFYINVSLCRFNFLQYCRVSEEVAKLLTSLFRQCYLSTLGKKWSENDGASFLNKDKFHDRYYEFKVIHTHVSA